MGERDLERYFGTTTPTAAQVRDCDERAMIEMHLERSGGLWIAHISTVYGHMEFLCGEGAEPDIETLALVECFFDDSVDRLAAIRRARFGLPFLWRPIRLAVNDEGRLGVQFMQRLTGRQEGMFFADEHSAFATRLADVVVDENDKRRFGGS